MTRKILFVLLALATVAISGCASAPPASSLASAGVSGMQAPEKVLDESLPTIGILVFEGVLIAEVIPPADVFTKPDVNGKMLFNVVTIGAERKVYTAEEGLHIVPDYTFEDAPSLDVLVVPSSYHPEVQMKDEALVAYVKKKHETTKFTVSHCAGAFLLGATGVADGHKLVTYVGGGKLLREAFPNIDVQDDATVGVVEDGKFISSNGNMMTYPATFLLLEKMSSRAHRDYVSDLILYDRLLKK